MQSVLKMADLELSGKRVVIREDLNVPMKEGVITNDARLRAALPTIRLALKKNAAVILLAHLGRPKEGVFDAQFSLEPIAKALEALLGKPVIFAKDGLDGVNVRPGEVVLCENVRFNVGEKSNDENLARRMARLGDVFVMDAFGAAHRAHASTYGIAQFAPIACAGPLLVSEIEALEKTLANPQRPALAVIGGSKVSTKLEVLASLIQKVDSIFVGGGMANTFIAAEGYSVGQSLYEPDLIPQAQNLMEQARKQHVKLLFPQDVVVATACRDDAIPRSCALDQVRPEEMILDVGAKTIAALQDEIQTAKTILWNGPVGVFEISAFSQGTEAVAKAVANSSAYSIVGGGDTIAAIEQFGISQSVSYISTGGGAFLEFVEGKTLPALAILMERFHSKKD